MQDRPAPLLPWIAFWLLLVALCWVLCHVGQEPPPEDEPRDYFVPEDVYEKQAG